MGAIRSSSPLMAFRDRKMNSWAPVSPIPRITFVNIGSWVITPGQHTVQAEIDYFGNPVANSSFNFTPVTLGPELARPLPG